MSISSPSDSLYPSPCRAGRPARVWAAFRCVAVRACRLAASRTAETAALIARARVHTGGPRGARAVVTARRLRRGGSGNRSGASLTRVNARLSALSCGSPCNSRSLCVALSTTPVVSPLSPRPGWSRRADGTHPYRTVPRRIPRSQAPPCVARRAVHGAGPVQRRSALVHALSSSRNKHHVQQCKKS